MINEQPGWKMWLHEFVQHEYTENMTVAIDKMVGDVYNTTMEQSGNRTYIAKNVSDLTVLLGYTILEMNNQNSTYYTLCNTDGSNTYILLEMDNEIHINKNDWLNRIGLIPNTNKLKLYFSVIEPSNDTACKICKDMMYSDVGSKINYINTFYPNV